MSVVIETTKGVFTVDLYTEARPKSCKNFLKLCKVKFYNFSLFHTVQPNFIAQAGDPTGLGKNGGESIYRRLYGDQATFFEGELIPKIKHSKKGLISMVSVGDNMFGSQFFITLDDGLDYLDGKHCVFGEIVEGLDDILKMFNETICDEQNRPYQDIRVCHTVILDDPFDDPPGLEIPDRSPSPTKEMLESTRIGADEDLDDFDGMDMREITELMAEKEARAQATILEMIGDLPDADVAPPENVLFVCKLNPVTTDDDLEIIFSRFGKVKSCEVIRDRKTNDSLQYAFVEFENPKSCETAYFKMDNVLIDDRRIHVDFSQSVSKFRWKGKGRLEIVGEDDRKERPANVERSSWRDQKGSRKFDVDRRDKNIRQFDDSRDRDRQKDSRERKRERSADRNYGRQDQKRSAERRDRRDDSRDFNRRDDSKDRKRHRSRDRQREQLKEKSRDRCNDNSKLQTEDGRSRRDDRQISQKKKKKDRHSSKSSDSESSDFSSEKKRNKKLKKHRSRSRERHSKKYRS